MTEAAPHISAAVASSNRVNATIFEMPFKCDISKMMASKKSSRS